MYLPTFYLSNINPIPIYPNQIDLRNSNPIHFEQDSIGVIPNDTFAGLLGTARYYIYLYRLYILYMFSILYI